MKDSEIYRKAAKLLERGTSGPGCCTAIRDVTAIGAVRLSDEMRQLFVYRRKPFGMYWMRDCGEIGDIRDRRILALCFMAAIAESEGR